MPKCDSVNYSGVSMFNIILGVGMPCVMEPAGRSCSVELHIGQQGEYIVGLGGSKMSMCECTLVV